MIIIGCRMKIIFASACAQFLQYYLPGSAFSVPIMMALTLQGIRHCRLHEYCIS